MLHKAGPGAIVWLIGQSLKHLHIARRVHTHLAEREKKTYRGVYL